MSRNPSISMTQHQQEFVSRMVQSGRYKGVSEVVRAGLRLLEDREEARAARLDVLDALVQQGFDSGPAEPLEGMADIVRAADDEPGR